MTLLLRYKSLYIFFVAKLLFLGKTRITELTLQILELFGFQCKCHLIVNCAFKYSYITNTNKIETA